MKEHFGPTLARSRRRDRCALGRAGFTLVELLLVISIIALLISIILPVMSEGRRTSWQLQNITNLRNFGTAAGSYAATFHDRIWSFSWGQHGNRANALRVGRNGFEDDMEAAEWQAIDIIRRRATPNQPAFPDQGAWIPHVLYAHLVLQDFLASRLPEPMVRSPFDRVRHEWAEAVLTRSLPNIAEVYSLPGDPETTGQRWPYSSSYQQVPACYTPDIEHTNQYLRQSEFDGAYLYAVGRQFPLGGRRFGDVAFPSNKVMVMESMSRHHSRTPYFFTHPYARTTNLFFDASVRVVPNPDFNKGGYLRDAGAVLYPMHAAVTYVANPSIGLPPWPDDSSPEDREGFQRWTLRGLKGIDTGGKQLYGDDEYLKPQPR
ncbi:MAG: prepilin-type N-terminal cleavage/methylation domain-containing protein [Phycisphaerales bacterium]